MRTRTLPLLAVVACAAGLGGCGETTDRDRVRSYIEAVNAVHDEAAPALQQANETYGRFARGKLEGPAAVRAMRRNQATIAVLRRRIETLDAPAKARTLRRLLLATFDANAGMAQQTTLLATYVPAQERTLRDAQKLGRRLERHLRAAASDPDAQAGALRTYADGLQAVVDRMRALAPPLVLKPARDAQLQRLRGSREVAKQLRTAVLDRDADAVSGLLQRFRELNAKGLDPSASKAAYKAYTDYVEALRTTEQRVAVEVARLDESLA